MAREINLVPDIKEEMIKALRMRNFTFFVCLVVCAASLGAIIVFAGIAGGQQAAVDGKKNTLTTLSQKISDYSDLSDFLTIKDQLGNLSTITSNKKMFSRTLRLVPTFVLSGPDSIQVSRLSVDLTVEQPTLTIEAQANAIQPPYIDYNVLDSFKKSMQYMTYDYGTYVDKNGAAIPAYCIIENNNDGTYFYDAERGLYALWLINGEGCNPSAVDSTDSDSTAEVDGIEPIIEYATEEYNGQAVVRIWRTPQFNDWYRSEISQDQPYMSLDGSISNVPHFESRCIVYSGVSTASGQINWSSVNDSCVTVPGGSSTDGIVITESSNGRDSSGELVLRFVATISLNPEIYRFDNHHMIFSAPTGRSNVTDSYTQIKGMFTERAKDCDENDSACKTNTKGDN